MSWAQAAMFLLGEGMKNQQRMSQPVKAGSKNAQVNRPVISLSPKRNAHSLMTMPPMGYQAASPGNNIPAATLDGGGGGGTDASMSMASAVNQARMGDANPLAQGFPKKFPPFGRASIDPGTGNLAQGSAPVEMTGTGQIRKVPQHLWSQGITTPAQYDAYLASQNSQKENSGPLYGNLFTREQLWQQEMMRRYKNSLDRGQTMRPMMWGLLGGLG